MLLCCLKSVLWTGNESAGDDVQHCENFQFTHKSLTSLVIFVSVSVEILLKLCPIAMNTYLQQTLWRVVIHRTQVVEEKWKFRVRQPYEGYPRASNEDFDEDLQRRFLARGV